MKKLHKYNKQEKTLFGKKINVDTTKELQDQHWFKSDLFSGRQKDFIEDNLVSWLQKAGLTEDQYWSAIKDISIIAQMFKSSG